MNHNLIIFMFVFVKNAQTESEFNLRNGAKFIYDTHIYAGGCEYIYRKIKS